MPFENKTIHNIEDLKEYIDKYFNAIKENANPDSKSENQVNESAGKLLHYTDIIMNYLLNSEENKSNTEKCINIWRKISDAFFSYTKGNFSEEKLDNIKDEILKEIETLEDSYDTDYFENMEENENAPVSSDDNQVLQENLESPQNEELIFAKNSKDEKENLQEDEQEPEIENETKPQIDRIRGTEDKHGLLNGLNFKPHAIRDTDNLLS